MNVHYVDVHQYTSFLLKFSELFGYVRIGRYWQVPVYID